jgi:hypothetical protein
MSLSPYGLFDFHHGLEPTFYVDTHSITVSPPAQFISDARSAVTAVSERSAEQISAEKGSIDSGDPYQRPRQPHWAEERDASVSAPHWYPPTPTPMNIGFLRVRKVVLHMQWMMLYLGFRLHNPPTTFCFRTMHILPQAGNFSIASRDGILHHHQQPQCLLINQARLGLEMTLEMIITQILRRDSIIPFLLP